MRYFGGFCFDETHGLLWQEGLRVPLTAKAAGVLACLIEAGERPLTKDEILRTVWQDTHVTPDNVKVLVREIRHALGDDARAARYVRTLSHGAYTFIAPVQKTPPSTGSSTGAANTSSCWGRPTIRSWLAGSAISTPSACAPGGP